MLVVSRFEPGNGLSKALGTGAVSRHVRPLVTRAAVIRQEISSEEKLHVFF